MNIGTTFHKTPMSREDMGKIVREAQADPCVEAFHRLFFHTPSTWGLTTYRGLPALKNPFDLQIYHELILSIRPRLVIETGTAYGGATMFFRDAMEMSGVAPNVITMDLEFQQPDGITVDWRNVEGVHRMQGSSLDPDMVARVKHWANECQGPVLVSLDSDHGKDHVLAELRTYGPLVTPGSYVVVEDTDLGGHPIDIGTEDGGPTEAIKVFREDFPDFEPDILCERYLFTSHPGGWLRRAGHFRINE